MLNKDSLLHIGLCSANYYGLTCLVKNKLRISHRDARFYSPENNLASFGKDFEISTDAVELNVNKTKDNQIAIHDADLKRTTIGESATAVLAFGVSQKISIRKAVKRFRHRRHWISRQKSN